MFPHIKKEASLIDVTRWDLDPFSLGSYSFIMVGSSFKDREILSKAVIYNGRLFFTGEHTFVDYPSTVHGAYLSGVSVAKRILFIISRNEQ